MMNTFNKNPRKSSDQEFSKELGQSVPGQVTFGKSRSKTTSGQTSSTTTQTGQTGLTGQTGRSYDITIPSGLEPGE